MAIVTNPALFVVGQNSAMWLDKATPTEMKVLGLQGMGLGIGFTQNSQDVPMMGLRIAPKVYTGATYDEMSANANYIPGDASQEALQNAALEGTVLKNIRMYLKDGCNFSAPDQISAGGGLTTGTSGMNVGSFSDPQIGSPSDIYTNSVTIAPACPFAVFVAHTNPGKGDDLTISGGGTGSDVVITIDAATSDTWAGFGFEVGDTVIVDYDGDSPAKPKYGHVKAIASNVMTLTADIGDAADIVVSGSALGATAAVHGATPMNPADMDITC
jgi:hypothetical protein